MWEQHPRAMEVNVARHDAIFAGAVERHGGVVIKFTGDGVFAAFSSSPAAVAAAIDAQRELAGTSWSSIDRLRARVGLHTGEAELRDGDYHGAAVNQAARLMVGHGDQIVVSHVVEELRTRFTSGGSQTSSTWECTASRPHQPPAACSR